MITTIDLNYSHNIFHLLSKELIENMENVLIENKKILLFLNRRWESSALICKDCSYHFKCKECDISLTIHKYPQKKLICHSCNSEEIIPSICPKCKWTNFIEIWTWTQKMEDNLNKIFESKKIIRLDSDKLKKEWISIKDIKDSDIIIATEIANTIWIENLWLIVFPLFEMELSSQEYDIEEKIYYNIAYNNKKWVDIIIQTYIPNNEILKIISSWNYKDFLDKTLKERKKFNYPPYSSFVNLRVKWNNKERVQEIFWKYLNKLNITNENSNKIIIADKKFIKRKDGNYYKKISIRWDNLEEFLEYFRLEIIRNRDIILEWR